MKNTPKMIADCQMVARLSDACMQAVHSFMNDVELRHHKLDIERSLNRMNSGTGMSPEAMNDPEHLEMLQNKRTKLASQLARINNFEHLIATGRLETDLNIDRHPAYFVLLGQTLKLDTEMDALHPLAQLQLVGLLNFIESFVRFDYQKPYPDGWDFAGELMNSEPYESGGNASEHSESCDGNCESCPLGAVHSVHSGGDMPDGVAYFLQNVLGVPLDKVQVISLNK